MGIKQTGIQRDVPNFSVETFMDIARVDPYRRFELSFELAKISEVGLDSMTQLAATYDEESQAAVGLQFCQLDLAGATQTPAVFTRMAFTYVISAPAFTLLSEYPSTLMWHVDGAMRLAGLDFMLPHEMPEEHRSAVRGMVIQSYVEGQCPVSTPYGDYVFAGSHLHQIAPVLPELEQRHTIDRALVESLISESRSPLREGIL